MVKKIFIGILGSVAFLMLAAYILFLGVNYSSDVSKDKQYWSQYAHNQEYVLERDVFLQKSTQGMAKSGRFILIPESSYKHGLGRHDSSPDSIAAYDADPEKASIKKYENFEMNLNVAGVLRKGTGLRLTKFEKHSGFNIMYGHVETLTPWAEILDGKYKGKIVDITDISVYYREKKGEGIFIYKPEKGVIALSKP